jgi:two-component sensor histidine kinase
MEKIKDFRVDSHSCYVFNWTPMDDLAQLQKRVDALEQIVDQLTQVVERSAESLANLSALVKRLTQALSAHLPSEGETR